MNKTYTVCFVSNVLDQSKDVVVRAFDEEEALIKAYQALESDRKVLTEKWQAREIRAC